MIKTVVKVNIDLLGYVTVCIGIVGYVQMRLSSRVLVFWSSSDG